MSKQNVKAENAPSLPTGLVSKDKAVSVTRTFTKGPWLNDGTLTYYGHHVVRRNGVVVCNMVKQTTMSESEFQANAALVTAAPTLYEALNALASHTHAAGSCPRPCAILALAQAALVLAESKVTND